ncbi:hypothetical protein RSAG8_11756, partial [Rhizoctonia solani AG-8 WAC10335]
MPGLIGPYGPTTPPGLFERFPGPQAFFVSTPQGSSRISDSRFRRSSIREPRDSRLGCTNYCCWQS